MKAAAALLLVLAAPGAAAAQDYGGHVSALFVVMPDVDAAAGRQPVAELRTRLFAEGFLNPGDDVHIRAGVFVDGLVADRGPLAAGTTAAAAIDPADIYVEYRGRRLDLRAGMSRIVWGRLDEFQPTDVVNPIDLSRFVFEGRSEARLPVGLARLRLFLPRSSTLEAIAVPVFRSSRFDRLEEETSPFFLAPAGERDRREPPVAWTNLQGGARFTSTVARVDWGVSAWRGFESFPSYTAALVPAPPGPPALRVAEIFPRFTMIGADFETVRGPWGIRGELAWFDGPAPRSFEGGIGADRRAGDYRVAGNVIVTRAAETDVALVGWAERSFARETRRLRLLTVYDPADDTAFLRGIATFSLRDNLALEASAGWITGDVDAGTSGSIDVLALLARRDFLYTQLKYFF